MLYESFLSEQRQMLKQEELKPGSILPPDSDEELVPSPQEGGEENEQQRREEKKKRKQEWNQIRVESILFKKYCKKLGSRIGAIGFGGAPTRPEVSAFIRKCFGLIGKIKVVESYGTTELGGITWNDRIIDGLKVKLLDVPELGFFSTNQPYPQGEICVCSAEATTGYWQDKEQTDKLFYVDPKTGDKYIKTGDVGELQPNRILKVLERKSNLIKLSNGTFIAPERLEGVLAHCPSVSDVFVYVESGWDFPLAVITLSDAAALQQQHAIDDTTTIINPNNETQLQKILQEFRDECEVKNICAGHVPKGILVATERFSVQNNCLTTSLKLARPKLRLKFGGELSDIYDQLTMKEMRSESSSGMFFQPGKKEGSMIIGDSEQQNSSSRILTTLEKIFRYVLRVKHPLDPSLHTAQRLGCDSIALAILQTKIFTRLGVELSFHSLWDTTLIQLAAIIEKEHDRNAKWGRMNSFQVCDNSTTILGEDTAGSGGEGEMLKRLFLQDTDMQHEILLHQQQHQNDEDGEGERKFFLSSSSLEAKQRQEVWLLTGCTGFIMKEVLKVLLTHMSSKDSEKQKEESLYRHSPPDKIYLLLRGNSLQEVIKRLELPETVQKILLDFLNNEGAQNEKDNMETSSLPKVKILLGDLNNLKEDGKQNLVKNEEEDLFGLTTKTWKELRRSVTHVIHGAANVNHVLPYGALRSTNVLALKALLQRLFLGRPASYNQITYLSTISVFPLMTQGTSKFDSATPTTSPQNEEDIDEKLPIEKISEEFWSNAPSYSGYVLSKFAAEKLLLNYYHYYDDDQGNEKRQGEGQKVEEKEKGVDSGVSQINIVRPGMTSWHTIEGHGNVTDWFVRLCRGVLALHAYPSVAEELPMVMSEGKGAGTILNKDQMGNDTNNKFQKPATTTTPPPRHSYLNLIPVNMMAESIAAVAERKTIQRGGGAGNVMIGSENRKKGQILHVFHFINPKRHVSLQGIFDALISCSSRFYHGAFVAKKLPLEDWMKLVEVEGGGSSSSSSSSGLQALRQCIHMFRRGLPNEGGQPIDIPKKSKSHEEVDRIAAAVSTVLERKIPATVELYKEAHLLCDGQEEEGEMKKWGHDVETVRKFADWLLHLEEKVKEEGK